VQPASTVGMFIFLIRNLRVGNDIRFTRLLHHMKVRDIQATGGLTKQGFLSLCHTLFSNCKMCVPLLASSSLCRLQTSSHAALCCCEPTDNAVLYHVRDSGCLFGGAGQTWRHGMMLPVSQVRPAFCVTRYFCLSWEFWRCKN
jgi:hypothetical protein